MRTLRLWTVAVSLSFVSCKKDLPGGTPPAAPTFGDDAQALVSEFQSKLKMALLSAMQKDGPAAAIEVCKSRAPQIAKEVSNDEFRIRRIGTRTRNPDNQPSAADKKALARLSETTPQLTEQNIFYQAIFAQPLCLTCHGPEETLSAEVKQALERYYEGDEATGYKAGDLRGAFVVQRVNPN